MKQLIKCALGVAVMLAAASVVSADTGAAQEDLPESLAKMLRTQEKFVQHIADSGIKEGFLKYLTDGGVVFYPDPRNGLESYYSIPMWPGRVKFEATHSLISAAGDLGFITGPWQYFRPATDTIPATNGIYINIWHRQENGAYGLALNIGFANGEVFPENTPFTWRVLDGKANIDQSGAYGRISPQLFGLDSILNNSLGTEKVYEVYERVMAPGGTLCRNVGSPVADPQMIKDILREEEGKVSATGKTAFGSISDDLGYSFGQIRSLDPSVLEEHKAGGYMRLWAKEAGDWFLLSEIMLRREQGIEKTQPPREGEGILYQK